jgi:hypothetical protein
MHNEWLMRLLNIPLPEGVGVSITGLSPLAVPEGVAMRIEGNRLVCHNLDNASAG